MRVVLFGKNGQLGFEFEKRLKGHCELLALGRTDSGGDLTRIDEMMERLRAFSPDVVINAAAYTAVDLAQTQVEEARQVNALAPLAMAKYCHQSGALLVHFSTDYVFSGEGNKPWKEDDPCSPQNAYGQTKLEGENAIIESGCRHLIFRTSWVYGEHGKNFMKTILRLAQTKETLNVVDDQIGAPTSVQFLAKYSEEMIQLIYCGRNDLCGIYHLVPDGQVSWCGFARWIVKTATDCGMQLTLKPQSIKAIFTSEYPTPAKRPLNSRLSNEKLKSVLGIQSFETWDEDARVVLGKLIQCKVSSGRCFFHQATTI